MSVKQSDEYWREQWLNAIARDDLRDECREKRVTTGGRKMIVEFYCGIKGMHECARSANTEQVAAVAIYPLCSGYWLSMSRFNTRTEITNAVMAAIYAKWEAESKLKPGWKPRPIDRPRAMRSQHAGSYATFDMTISEGTLGEWQEFLTDLLSKSESWVPAPEVTKPVDDRLTREARDKKKEAKLQQKLTEQLFEAGYKVLATKLHPDKGGSHEAMTRLNQVRASLGSQK